MSTRRKTHPEADINGDCDEAGPSHLCVQGLIAANVALMTAYANPDPQALVSRDTQRQMLARKVASNLVFLREHPLLSPGLRQVMSSAHQLWAQLAAHADTAVGSDSTSGVNAAGSTLH